MAIATKAGKVPSNSAPTVEERGSRTRSEPDNRPWWRTSAAIIGGVLAFAQAPIASAAQLTLAWDWSDPQGRTASFRVDRKRGTSGSYSQIGTTAAGVKQYVDSIPNDTQYCYRVSATNSQTTSAFSNEVCASIPSSQSVSSPPPAPSSSPTTTTTSSSTARSEVVLDNAREAVNDGTRTYTGYWCTSGAPNAYGSDSLYNCASSSDTYRWTPSLASGTYDVYVRWTSNANRSVAVPIAVRHSQGTTSRAFNEQANGGAWVLHGTYSFAGGTSGYVEVSGVNGQASADAVRFVPR